MKAPPHGDRATPRPGRIVVLDDDPTATQTISGVTVVLTPDRSAIAAAAAGHDGPIWIMTNTRAVFGADLDVLRGDSTLRGHVLAEIDAASRPQSVALFVPAPLGAGRRTVGGVHLVDVGGTAVPVGQTEYARDAGFGFRSSRLVDWVAELGSGRRAYPVADRDIDADGTFAMRATPQPDAATTTRGHADMVMNQLMHTRANIDRQLELGGVVCKGASPPHASPVTHSAPTPHSSAARPMLACHCGRGTHHAALPHVIVPGNIGSAETMARLVTAIARDRPCTP